MSNNFDSENYVEEDNWNDLLFEEDNDDFPEEPDEPETDLDEIFTPEEIEHFFYGGPQPKLYQFRYNPKNENQRRALGRLLPHRIGQILKKMGFKPVIARGQSNGVDLKVYLSNSLVLVAEIKNYNIKSKITDGIIENGITNFNEYDCAKTLIYTQMANKDALAKFVSKGIHVFEIGYQLMPLIFYNSIRPPFRTYRKIDSKETTKDLELQLYKILNPIILKNHECFQINISL